MKYSKFTFIILLSLFSALVCQAMDDRSIFGVPDADNDVRPPAYLFHWDSYDGLLRIDQAKKNFRQLPLRRLSATDPENAPEILDEFPDLKVRPALFAWSHPTAAMGIEVTGDEEMPGEMYARPKNGHAAALITMRPKPDAKVIVIRTDGKGPKAIKFDQVDLVLHYKVDEFGIWFREWVVLNPNSIESFSADPKQLPIEVIDEMKNSTQVGALLKLSERFILKVNDEPISAAMVLKAQSPEFRGALVQGYLGTKSADLPKFFRHSLTPVFNCGSAFDLVAKKP